MDKHLWKLKWVVTEGDLTETENFAESAIRRIVKDTMHKGIAGNGKVTPNAGLVVTIPNCVTVDDIGRISDVTTQAVDMSVDELAVSTNPSVGNTRWVVVAAEYETLEANAQTDPVGGLPFFFHNLDSFKIRVIAGTETVGTPAVPSVGDAVILGGVILSNGQATITQDNLDAGDVSMVASRDMARGSLALMDNTQVVEGLPELSTGYNVQDFMNLVASIIFRRTGDQMEGTLQLVKSDEITTPPIEIRPGHKLNPNILLQCSETLVNSDLRKGAVVTQTSGTAIDTGALVNAITDEPSGFLRWNDNQNIGTVRIEIDHSANITAVAADQKYMPAAWLQAKPLFTAALKSIELFVETTVDVLQSVSIIDRDIDHSGTWPDNDFILLPDFDVNGPIEQAHYVFTFDASFPVDPGEFFSINQLMLYHANETLVGHLSPSWRALADISFAAQLGFDNTGLASLAGLTNTQQAIASLHNSIQSLEATVGGPSGNFTDVQAALDAGFDDLSVIDDVTEPADVVVPRDTFSLKVAAGKTWDLGNFDIEILTLDCEINLQDSGTILWAHTSSKELFDITLAATLNARHIHFHNQSTAANTEVVDQNLCVQKFHDVKLTLPNKDHCGIKIKASGSYVDGIEIFFGGSLAYRGIMAFGNNVSNVTVTSSTNPTDPTSANAGIWLSTSKLDGLINKAGELSVYGSGASMNNLITQGGIINALSSASTLADSILGGELTLESIGGRVSNSSWENTKYDSSVVTEVRISNSNSNGIIIDSGDNRIYYTNHQFEGAVVVNGEHCSFTGCEAEGAVSITGDNNKWLGGKVGNAGVAGGGSNTITLSGTAKGNIVDGVHVDVALVDTSSETNAIGLVVVY